MKALKIGIMLLAFLLAAMVMVPMVSAAETTATVSSGQIIAPTINVSQIQLPQLQFNASSKMVVVKHDLSPDNNVRSSVLLKTSATAQNEEISKIPYGSIIYHSNEGITSVFDSTGTQIFAADNTKAENVFTPQGYQPATFVHEIPAGSFVDTQNDRKYVIYDNQVILTEITQSSANRNTVMSAPSDWPPQYIEGVEYTPLQALGGFTSYWTVPTTPSSTSSGQITTIWNGLHKTSGGTGVLQPVLAWNENGDRRYTIRVWDVSDSGTYKSTQMGAKVGHQIAGDLSWDSSMGYWKVTIKDVNTGDTSPMYSNLVSPTSCQIALMLEGFNQPLQSIYEPGAITFTNNVLRSTGGTVITPQASAVSAYVADSWFSGNNLLAVNKNNWPGSVVFSTGGN